MVLKVGIMLEVRGVLKSLLPYCGFYLIVVRVRKFKGQVLMTINVPSELIHMVEWTE